MRIPPCGNYGDVNDDGTVSDADVTLTADGFMGSTVLTEEQKRRADVNSNARIDIGDVAAIANYADGNIDTFPVCAGYGEDAKTVFKTFAAAGIIIYVFVKLLWK